MIPLGVRAKDKISGYTGIVTGRTQWINGCVRVMIDSEKVKDDGTIVEGQWFDSQIVEVLDDNTGFVPEWDRVKLRRTVKNSFTGGPQKDPQIRKDPK